MYYLRGIGNRDRENYQGAINDFTKILNSYNHESSLYTPLDLYTYRGMSYYNNNDYATAEADLKEAKRLGSENSLVYFYLALINRSNAYRNSGQAKQGYFDIAIENLTKSIELDPNMSTFYSLRGEIYLDYYNFDDKISSKYEMAVADFTKAIQFDSEDADYYYNRAMAYHLLGKYSNAQSDYAAAARIEPALYNNAEFSDRKKRADGNKKYKGLGILKDF
jgi:tetratricopeptide (TPR) repeat protein